MMKIYAFMYMNTIRFFFCVGLVSTTAESFTLKYDHGLLIKMQNLKHTYNIHQQTNHKYKTTTTI